MNGSSKKDALLRELSELWENPMLRTVFLIMLAVIGSFVLQQSLVLILRTDYPLHTPISGSMEPTLNIGDLLIVQGVQSANDITVGPKPGPNVTAVGDIIIFRKPGSPDQLIVHRAIKKFQEAGKWYFITKGDANPSDDWETFGWKIPESDVVGKVIFHVPLLGYVLRFLDETKIYVDGYGLTVRMVLIVVLIAAFFIVEYTSPSEQTEEPSKGEEMDTKDNSLQKQLV